jgi:hypothetical protein
LALLNGVNARFNLLAMAAKQLGDCMAMTLAMLWSVSYSRDKAGLIS